MKYDTRPCKPHNRPTRDIAMHCRAVIEIVFGSLKDWYRSAPWYDKDLKVFLRTITLAVIVIYWL